MAICSVENCVNPVKSRGLCNTHYLRDRRLGSYTLPKRKLKRDKKCQFCTNLVNKKGARNMCPRHYKTYLKYGDALYIDKQLQYEQDVLDGKIIDDTLFYRTYKKPTKDGYIRDKDKRYIHKRIMEQKIGRPLLNNVEVVHHIDLNKLNNKPDNLHLCENRSEHNELHNQLNALNTYFIDKKAILFKDGKYIVNPDLDI